MPVILSFRIIVRQVQPAGKYHITKYNIYNLKNFLQQFVSFFLQYRLRPVSVKDKAVMHCLILALMIRGYRLNLQEFSEQINANCGINKLKSLARLLGAVVDKSEKDTIIMKCPLPPPPQIVKRISKKK